VLERCRIAATVDIEPASFDENKCFQNSGSGVLGGSGISHVGSWVERGQWAVHSLRLPKLTKDNPMNKLLCIIDQRANTTLFISKSQFLQVNLGWGRGWSWELGVLRPGSGFRV